MGTHLGRLHEPAQVCRLHACLDVFNHWMHLPAGSTDVVTTLLGTIAANHLRGEEPVWLMVTGPTGGGKTTLVNAFDWMPHTEYIGEMSPAGLLSWRKDDNGVSQRDGLLLSVEPFGFLVAAEFSALLSKTHNQSPVMTALRKIYDGHYPRSIKSETGDPLEWRGKCGFLGASAPGIETHRHVMSEMGERFAYYRLEYTNADEREISRKIAMRGNRGKLMRDSLRAATRDALEPLLKAPPEIELTDVENDRLYHLATFAARCRSHVERDGSFSRTAHEVHGREMGGGRLLSQLSALFKGLLSVGAPYATAWRILDTVCWSSIPILRGEVLRLVLANTDPCDGKYFGGLRKISDLYQRSTPDGRGCAVTTLSRALEDLTLQGVLQRQPGGRKGVMDGWRVAPEVWISYAAAQDDPPAEPDRRIWRALELVPSMTAGESKRGNSL